MTGTTTRVSDNCGQPAQDAVSLAEVLGDPEVGDFDVEVLRNERVDAIRRGIERFFSEGGREDTLMLHFSCHGLKSESGSLYFAARDTEPRLLEATAVSAQFVRHCMFRTRAKRTVLFLDCCYGGAFSRGSSSVRAAGTSMCWSPSPGRDSAADGAGP